MGKWAGIVGDGIARHGFVTISMLARRHPEITRKRWEAIVAAEVRAGRIKAHPFRGREQYFIFTADECRQRGLHPKKARPFGAQALITRLGQMLFTTHRGVELLSRADIAAKAPSLLVRGISADRYAPLPDNVLGLVIVDCGSEARHLGRKAAKEIWRRTNASDAWKEVIELNGFRIVYVLGDEGKAKKLRRRLTNKSIPAEVVVFEELGPFITEKV